MCRLVDGVGTVSRTLMRGTIMPKNSSTPSLASAGSIGSGVSPAAQLGIPAVDRHLLRLAALPHGRLEGCRERVPRRCVVGDAAQHVEQLGESGAVPRRRAVGRSRRTQVCSVAARRFVPTTAAQRCTWPTWLARSASVQPGHVVTGASSGPWSTVVAKRSPSVSNQPMCSVVSTRRTYSTARDTLVLFRAGDSVKP